MRNPQGLDSSKVSLTDFKYRFCEMHYTNDVAMVIYGFGHSLDDHKLIFCVSNNKKIKSSYCSWFTRLYYIYILDGCQAKIWFSIWNKNALSPRGRCVGANTPAQTWLVFVHFVHMHFYLIIWPTEPIGNEWHWILRGDCCEKFCLLQAVFNS